LFDSAPEVQVNYIPGRDPTAIFYNKEGTEIDRVSVADMDEAQIHALLQSKGFQKKPTAAKVIKLFPSLS
jgi:hypothetical protein